MAPGQIPYPARGSVWESARTRTGGQLGLRVRVRGTVRVPGATERWVVLVVDSGLHAGQGHRVSLSDFYRQYRRVREDGPGRRNNGTRTHDRRA